MYARSATFVLAILGATAADASLIGTELRIGSINQVTSSSEVFINDFPASAIVSDAVEFPSADSLFGILRCRYIDRRGRGFHRDQLRQCRIRVIRLVASKYLHFRILVRCLGDYHWCVRRQVSVQFGDFRRQRVFRRRRSFRQCYGFAVQYRVVPAD